MTNYCLLNDDPCPADTEAQRDKIRRLLLDGWDEYPSRVPVYAGECPEEGEPPDSQRTGEWVGRDEPREEVDDEPREEVDDDHKAHRELLDMRDRDTSVWEGE